MITVVIIDDERLARENLKAMLARINCKMEIVGEADSVISGEKLITQKKPNLVFLDIDLGEGSGFNLLDRLENPSFKVIFITAHNNFALNAFRVNAVDYILKPIDFKLLSNAVERVKERCKMESAKSSVLAGKLKASLKLAVNENDGIRFIDLHEIMRCKSDDNYTEIYLLNGSRLLTSRPLKEYESILESHGFVRTHQSHLINISKIAKIVRKDGLFILMTNGDLVPIARRKKDEIFARMVEIQV